MEHAIPRHNFDPFLSSRHAHFDLATICSARLTRLSLITVPTSGDRIIVVVQKQRSFGPESGPGGAATVAAVNKVRRGDIRHAVVVRTVKKYQRIDGSVVRFDDNACVLINKAGEPIGSRLNGMLLILNIA